jgi:hypothetical protein
VKQLVTMREALTDPALLGNILAGPSWESWRVLLIAAMGEPLTRTERKIFKKLSGRSTEPGERVDELWAVVGRRGGKSRAAATLAAYLGALCDHSDVAAPGERPLILCLGQNQKQAGVCFGYVDGVFASSPMLAPLITNRTAEALELSTGVAIEVRAASPRGLRGITAAAVIGDEAAFWATDDNSANADSEILTAVRPTLATTGGPLIVISSPYAQRGEVYQTWKDHYGANGDKRILVVQGASRDFNPSLPKAVVDRALARDRAAASAEYLGLFRNDLESFITPEVIDACIVSGRRELPPNGELMTAFLDVSGGVNDAHCCSLAFKNSDDIAVLACAREIKSADTEAVVAEFAALLRSYGLTEAWSDRYAARWVFDAFLRAGVSLKYSPKNKSELYLDALYAMRARRVELLDLVRLRGQLLGLQRRTTTTGRDVVEDRNKADDLANSCCGALVMAASATEHAWIGIPMHQNDVPLDLEYERLANVVTNGGPICDVPLKTNRDIVADLKNAKTQSPVGRDLLNQMWNEDADDAWLRRG